MSHKLGRKNSIIYAIRHPTESRWLRVGACSYGNGEGRKIRTAEWQDSIVSVARTVKGANTVIGMLPAYWQDQILRLEARIASNELELAQALSSTQPYVTRYAEQLRDSIQSNERLLRTLYDSLAITPVVVEVTIETMVSEQVV